MIGDTFHDHLDHCRQCRDHPMHLCPTGLWLLKDVEDPARATTTADLVDQADQWHARERELEAAIREGARRVPWYLHGEHARRVPDALERLTRIAGKLEIPQWLAEESAVQIAIARGCMIEEGYERLAHELETLAAVQSVARKEQ